MNRENAGSRVVGDPAQASAIVTFVFVLHAADFRRGFDDREQTVDVEVRWHSLQDAGGSFQSHAGVDVLAGQRMQVVRGRADAIELGEHQVPNFDVAAVFQLVIDLAAGTADSVRAFAGCRRGPEVFVLVHSRNALGRQSDLVVPNAKRFVVIFVDRDRQTLAGDAQPLFVGQEFPRPVDGFFFEIIAERKVAQHFEERVVERGPAHIVDVTGSQAFLARGRASEIQFDLSKEVVFELVHPRGSEQNRWIPSRNEHVAGLADATFGLKERQVFFAQFVSFHQDVRVDSTRKRSGIEPRGLAFHRRHDISRCPTGDRCRISAHNAGRQTAAAMLFWPVETLRRETTNSTSPLDIDFMTQRIERLVQSIADSDQPMDAILICSEVNVRYLSGFTGDSTWLLVRPDGKATLLSDRRYETQIAEECPALESAIRPPSQTLVALLAEYLADSSLKTIGFEADHVQVSTMHQWKEQIESVEWTQTSGLVETLRSIKDADELATIRRAISIAERSFLSVTNKLTPRMTELQIAHELEATMRSLGASGVAFDVIAGAEPSGALPHYHPRNIALADCRTLLIDWGARVDGYCSDLTRTLHKADVRSATADRFEAAYQAVLESQEAAISAIRDGVEAIEVDRAARQVLQNAGLGDAFKHGLGHSFGLEIHEDPRMGPMSTDVLREGMVLTVEPGVYFEGEFGIRIEDDILVTADGFERLSTLPKGLDDCRLVV